MKCATFTNETRKPAGDPFAGQLKAEPELLKKLSTCFELGESCYFVFNFQRSEFEYISQETEALLGYKPEEIATQFIPENIHPDDWIWCLNCRDIATRFQLSLPPGKQLKYKIRFDFRIRKKDWTYLRVMMQLVVIHHDENGGIGRILIVLTDIDHLKQHGKPVLSFIGLEGEPSYTNVALTSPLPKRNEEISKREKEVLSLVMQGKLSKEIAAVLKISKQTVDKHRKNMLHKSKLNTTAELVSKAYSEGWVSVQ